MFAKFESMRSRGNTAIILPRLETFRDTKTAMTICGGRGRSWDRQARYRNVDMLPTSSPDDEMPTMSRDSISKHQRFVEVSVSTCQEEVTAIRRFEFQNVETYSNTHKNV